MQVVQLHQSDIITESSQTIIVDFSAERAISNPSQIGAADRFRDWE